jgi:hypothetical protein
MKEFQQNKDALNRELEQFISKLNEVLPRYTALLNKVGVTAEEVSELGQLEHFLIELNYKISEVKHRLEQDLFGYSLATYFNLKKKSAEGDPYAAMKIERMKKVFEESLRSGNIINWN